jgi:hypothetical protein
VPLLLTRLGGIYFFWWDLFGKSQKRTQQEIMLMASTRCRRQQEDLVVGRGAK